MMDVYRDVNGKPELVGSTTMEPPKERLPTKVMVRKPFPISTASIEAWNRRQAQAKTNLSDIIEWFEVWYVGDFGRYVDGCVPAIRLAEDQDPKLLPGYRVADEVYIRERIAKWMIENDFATGHGDTIDDLLSTLKGQIEELRQNLANAIGDAMDLDRAG